MRQVGGRGAHRAGLREESIHSRDYARRNRLQLKLRLFKEDALHHLLAFNRIERAVGKDDAPAGLQQPDRRLQQAELHGGQFFDFFR